MLKHYIPYRSRAFRDVEFRKLVIIINFEIEEVTLKTTNGKVVGFSQWTIDKKKRSMHIHDFEITPKYRGKGYGSFLARVIIDIARLYHIKHMTLVDGATLEGFWQHLGFGSREWSSNLVLKL